MPKVEIIFYQEKKGECPIWKWLAHLPKKVQEKADVRIERLAECGHELRRPEADYLRDGIYELRWKFQSVNYRILYFFYWRRVVILAHGLTKEGTVPKREIELAIERKIKFHQNPNDHSYREREEET